MPNLFDVIVDRRDSGCAKWSAYEEDVLPMWVADMDFKSPEPILAALQARVAHGVFGYELPSRALHEAIVAWLDKRYQWKITPSNIVFLPGLVAGVNAACRAYGHIGESAVVLAPVYSPFLTAPGNQGMSLDTTRLTCREDGNHIRYEVDFDAFERAITPRTKLFIHCHPHNPIGHEYTLEENRRLAEICIKHDLIICSDEIHCDLMLGDSTHEPMAALSPEIAERTITLMAPSKTFNVPGLGFSFAVVQNQRLRQRLQQAGSGILSHVNALGLAAAHAAYTECDAWLAELQAYLTKNRDTLVRFVNEHMPAIHTTNPEATYLAWFDCRSAGVESNPFQFFLKHARVALSDGATFGTGGEGFVRFNFGCPRAQMVEALERMAIALKVAPRTHEAKNRATVIGRSFDVGYVEGGSD
jgi:cystathionine beta-lyase